MIDLIKKIRNMLKKKRYFIVFYAQKNDTGFGFGHGTSVGTKYPSFKRTQDFLVDSLKEESLPDAAVSIINVVEVSKKEFNEWNENNAN